MFKMSLLEWVKDLFIPHYRNNHKARLLHPAFLSVLVALFLTVQFSLNFFVLVFPSILGFASNINHQEVIRLTNLRRIEKGLPALVESEKLDLIAEKKAQDMFIFNYWAHYSPSGKDPWSFFKEANYSYLYAGENLARDFMDSESVVTAWMNSPSHKDNLLHPQYKEVGLAVVNGVLNGVETTLVVQAFGTPTPAISGQRTALKKPSLGSAVALAAEPSPKVAQKISPFFLTKTFAVFLLGLILGVLLLDAVLVAQHRIIRLSGKNLAHLLFIATLLLAIIITSQGAIL